MKIKRIEKEISTKVKCPVCGRVVHCPDCCDWICPDCGGVFKDTSEHKDLLFIDLFAGCGGLSLGLINAGWKGYFAIEKSPDAFNTFKHNLVNNGRDGNYNGNIEKYANWPNWLEIKAWEISELLDKHLNKLKGLKGKVQLLAGGPPCQGFSLAGKRNFSDERNQLFKKYLECVNLIDPPLILIENVVGMSIPFSKSDTVKSYATQLKESLEENYIVEQKIIQSSRFGVPQLRPRFITVGFSKKMNLPASFFERLEEHREEFLSMKGLDVDKPVNVEDAVGDIDRCKKTQICDDPFSPKGKFYEIVYDENKIKSPYQKLMRDGCVDNYQPDSLRLVNHKEYTKKRFKLMRKYCRSGVTIGKEERTKIEKELNIKIKKQVFIFLDGKRPAHTITTIPDDLVHYKQPRVHTVREYARFQSFPDWFEFKGKFTTGGSMRKLETPRYTQVGNAVPPLLAEVIGRVLIKSLLNC